MNKGVISVLSALTGAAVGAVGGAAAVGSLKAQEEQKWKQMSDKHLALMLLFNQWLATKQEGKSVVDYFHANKIESIAIYGMSYVGERLLDELKGTDVKVKYAIDKNADGIYTDMEVLTPDEALPEVDAIVVTPIFFFDEIEKMLAQKTQAQILSMEDILYEL